MTQSDLLDLTALLRIALDIALIGAFILSYLERGIRMYRSSIPFILYWFVSMVYQLLQHEHKVQVALWWDTTARTFVLFALCVTLVWDLREHYRQSGNGNGNGKK